MCDNLEDIMFDQMTKFKRVQEDNETWYPWVYVNISLYLVDYYIHVILK